MRSASKSIFAIAISILVSALWAVPQADARRVGGVGVHPRVGHAYAHPGARAAARNYRRGRWVNGVWVATGVAATGVAVGAGSNCNYYYRKWKATGSAYWHDRYYGSCR